MVNEARPGPGRGLAAASEALAWVALSAAVVAVVPLFLRLATWGDCTLFDLAARSLLRHGHCYRDIFIHGPPGMVWFQLAVRSLVGWRSEALRASDLVIFAAVASFLARGVQPRGLPRAASVWIAAALFLCYSAATEWAHCQTDGWMLLPALGALCLRQRQSAALLGGAPAGRVLAGRALAEGVLWGVAFVVKPFVVFAAVPCLLLAWVPALRALRKRGEARRIVWDAAGVLAGGLLVGTGTFAALYFTGDWPEFLAATFGGWNRDYALQATGWRAETYYAFFVWEWPRAAVHLVAVPVALALVGSALRRRPASEDDPGDGARLPLLAAFYLGWFFQANFLQLQYEYHILPCLLVGYALVLGWLCRLLPRLSLAVVLPALIPALALTNPLLEPGRRALWAECWTSGDSDRLKDELAINRQGGHTSWRDLRGVTLYLREQGARDREVTCWNFAAIPYYTESGLEPSTRFVFPAERMGFFPSFKQTIRDETMNSPQRFVVMDLSRKVPEIVYRQRMRFTPDLVEPFKPVGVYHSGRYVVLRLGPPPGPGDRPG